MSDMLPSYTGNFDTDRQRPDVLSATLWPKSKSGQRVLSTTVSPSSVGDLSQQHTLQLPDPAFLWQRQALLVPLLLLQQLLYVAGGAQQDVARGLHGEDGPSQSLPGGTGERWGYIMKWSKTSTGDMTGTYRHTCVTWDTYKPGIITIYRNYIKQKGQTRLAYEINDWLFTSSDDLF